MTDRLELISRIQGESDTGDSVVLVNISESGLLIHTDHALEVGEVHEFRFQFRGGATLLFAARVVRTSRADAGPNRYAIGLLFEETATARQRTAIRKLQEFGGLRPMPRDRHRR
ncbi:MAG: PilZ domain-containing protein [Vicinamibacterales bacterium]